jgi:ribosomal protein S18 acetylase RimI-like enzyme
MTAAAYSQARKASNGLRPVNSRRDMAGVADLIEIAFSRHLDPGSRRLVREMRTFGRAGLLGWLVGRLFLPSAAYPLGFVWEENRRLVGNASVLAVNRNPQRWVLANVAVHPEFQRQGIGRALTLASLEFAQERRATEMILQVDSSNHGAQKMYTSLGFQTRSTRTEWMRSFSRRLSPEILPPQLQRPQAEQWREQFKMAERLYSEGAIWPFPNTSDLFRPNPLTGIVRVPNRKQFIWNEGDRILGSITARRAIDFSRWNLLMMVEPELRGQVEGLLLDAVLNDLGQDGQQIKVDYWADTGAEQFRERGFRSKRTLTWMSYAF